MKRYLLATIVIPLCVPLCLLLAYLAAKHQPDTTTDLP